MSGRGRQTNNSQLRRPRPQNAIQPGQPTIYEDDLINLRDPFAPGRQLARGDDEPLVVVARIPTPPLPAQPPALPEQGVQEPQLGIQEELPVLPPLIAPEPPLNPPIAQIPDQEALPVIQQAAVPANPIVENVLRQIRQLPQRNMAQPASVAMRDIISVVPPFDGHSIPLSDFIEGCDLAFSMIDPAAEQILVRILRSKLEGEVRKFIAGEQFATLEEFKQYLKEYYYSSKSPYELQGKMGTMVQKRGENVITYANKIKELALKIIDAYRIRNNPTPEQLETFRNSTNDSAMECFKRRLQEEIKMKLGNPATLRAMVREATEAERETFW